MEPETAVDVEELVADVDFEPILRLRKDLKALSESMTVDEARYLVDGYYQLQDHRKRSDNQIRAAKEEPHRVLRWIAEQMRALETDLKAALGVWSMSKPEGRWAQSIVGIGPVLSAGLMAHIDIEIANTAGKIYRFAGLDPTVRWEKGQKRPWNAELKTLCVLPNQTVSTRRGHLPIEEIEVGDEVLTHLGRWRRVTETFANEHAGTVYGLRSANAGNQVAWLTAGHPVYAAPVECWSSGRTLKPNESTRQAFGWHAVESVGGRWLLSRPALSNVLAEVPRLILRGEVEAEGRVAAGGRWPGVVAPRAHFVPQQVELDAPMMHLLGLYVAEGHISRTNAIWSFGSHEPQLVRFVKDMLASRFGLSPWIRENAALNSVQIGVGCKPLATMLRETFGGDSFMTVPTAFLSLPSNLLGSFFDGLMLGDGDHAGKFAGRRLSTASPALARQYVDIARKLGKSASLHSERGGRAYRVMLNERGDLTPSARTTLLAQYAGPVYNLEVEEDHSYVVDGYAVHNCWKIGDSFVKQSGNEKCLYGKIYRREKEKRVTKNEAGGFGELAKTTLELKSFKDKATRELYEAGKLPAGRVDLQARRVAVKLFLSHYQHVAYFARFAKHPPAPYVFVHQEGHSDYVPPPNFPWPEHANW